MNKPSPEEYKTYFQKYIDLVDDGSLIELLNINTNHVTDFFSAIPVEKENYQYQEGKWTIKDVFMHMIDTERGFSYRAIVCIRKDGTTPLYPMDEDFYASNIDVTNRSMSSLLEEFMAVRKSFSLLFRHSEPENLKFLGNAIDSKISARALGFIAIGHALHHMKVIQERYLDNQ